MSGVLHPVGPEPERVYWIRRGVVVLALAALVSLVLVLVNALGGGGGTTAVPAGTPEPSATGATTPSASAAASPTPTPSTPATPAPSASPSAAATPTARPSASPSASPQRVAAACDPAQLRPTLRGTQKVKSGQPITFALSYINGSKAACTLTFDRRTYELKIFSSSSRVWTSKDCSTAIRPVRVLLTPEKAFEFTQAWPGRGSKDDCKSRKAELPAGTYFVTSQLQGAEPVQLPIKLT